MATPLHINVSPSGNYSILRQLGNAAVPAWKKRNPGRQNPSRVKIGLNHVDEEG
jgi:FMN-dependent NADH-azoreductase